MMRMSASAFDLYKTCAFKWMDKVILRSYLTISTADVNKTERIEVLHNTEIITRRYLQIFYNATNRWDYFADIKSISIVPFAIDSIVKAAS